MYGRRSKIYIGLIEGKGIDHYRDQTSTPRSVTSGGLRCFGHCCPDSGGFGSWTLASVNYGALQHLDSRVIWGLSFIPPRQLGTGQPPKAAEIRPRDHIHCHSRYLHPSGCVRLVGLGRETCFNVGLGWRFHRRRVADPLYAGTQMGRRWTVSSHWLVSLGCHQRRLASTWRAGLPAISDWRLAVHPWRHCLCRSETRPVAKHVRIPRSISLTHCCRRVPPLRSFRLRRATEGPVALLQENRADSSR